MRRLSSGSVSLVLLGSLAAGCASEPEPEYGDIQADYTEICVSHHADDVTTMTREPDEKCPEGGNNFGTPSAFWWYYLGRTFAAPPVGQSLHSSWGSYARPASGVVARVPSSGGFGTYTGIVGG